MNIKEASRATGVSADTIRYYEPIGLIMPIERLNGIRKFGERNVNRIKFAKKMRNAGLSIGTLKDYVSLVFEDDKNTIPVRKEILGNALASLNEKINETVTARDYLQWKVDNYDAHMMDAENKMK